MAAIRRFVTEPHPCPYLPSETARLEYSLDPRLTPAAYEELMDRGHRKFGAFTFRPVCAGCAACRPIRIPVARFRPNRSQRRAWKQNRNLEVRLAPPAVEDRRLELYHRYHQAQARRKGWPETEKDVEDYAFSFLHSPVPAVEISLWQGDALRAVVLTDVTPRAVSGVYHYYDPDLRARGIGTYCMLRTIELARSLERPWAYFGYYVAGCASMEYKARFRPCELLGIDGVWREAREE
jgi:arginine-tRNA-protein transferase